MSQVFISAAHKSSGKTLVSTGLCAAYRRRGMRVAAFKKGPDYIDPAWLTKASGNSCWNLDFFTMNQEEILTCFEAQRQGADVTVVEGNKGLFDGLDVEGSDSNAALAVTLGLPVLLVIDVTGITRGIAPLLAGYIEFDPEVRIAGVILNRVAGPRQESKLRAAIERYSDLPVLGAIDRDPRLVIEERHLGLVPGNEDSDDPPSIDAWVKVVADAVTVACRERGLELPRLMCEPGRSLVASSGVTVYTVGARKVVPGVRTYISVDGGMSDNPRPITYQSLYTACLADRPLAPADETITLAGKHCESGDVLLKDLSFPSCRSGEVLVVLATGAYNLSMSSNYNRIPRPAAVLVHQGQAELIQRREQPEDLLRYDLMPDRLRSVQ